MRWLGRIKSDGAVALALGLGFVALYRLTFQARQYGDGPLLISVFGADTDGGAAWSHALYLPLASALWRAWEWSSPAAVLRSLSSVPAALAVALTYGLARGWSAPRGAALVAALLLGTSPGVWFFATTVEVHSLHAACVGLCACVVLWAPWQRPVLAALFAAAPLPLLFLSHQSGLLLGPGLVLLVQWARRRRGLDALGNASLLLQVGPLFLAVLLAGIPIGAALNRVELGPFLELSFDTVRLHDHELTLRSLWEGWLQPLALLLPLGLAGVSSGRVRGWARVALLALLLPPMTFFVAWGLPERGGYALGSGLFLAVLAAFALPASPRLALTVGALLIAAQGTFAWRSLRAFDTPGWRERMQSRASAVARLMPQRGVLITFDDSLQFVAEILPGVREHLGHVMLSAALESGQDPQAFAEALGRGLAFQCAQPGNVVVVDLSHRTHAAATEPRARAYLDAVEAWLLAHCEVARQEDPRWDLYAVRACE